MTLTLWNIVTMLSAAVTVVSGIGLAIEWITDDDRVDEDHLGYRS